MPLQAKKSAESTISTAPATSDINVPAPKASATTPSQPTSRPQHVTYASAANVPARSGGLPPVSTQTTNPFGSGPSTKGVKSMMRSAVTNATRLRNAPYANADRGLPTADGLANQFARLNPYGPPKAGVYDPSMGPSASIITTPFRGRRRPPSNVSRRTNAHRAVNNAVCKLSGMTREDFKKGDVITLPFHTANTNPHVDPATDNRWKLTVIGPVYSKRRMFVVLYIHGQDLFCLPLYSWNGKGIKNIPAWLRREYVCMKNQADLDFVNEGLYEPLVVEGNRRAMEKNTTVAITGGYKFGCNEDILSVGRLTQKSHQHLLRLWSSLSDEAQSEAWD